jgi:hypothetical protein
MVLIASFAVLTGCWHSIISTDLPPSTEVYHEGFKPAFVYGLVPAQLDASKYCGGRRWARIETQQTPVDWLVSAVTLGIFTPMDIRVTCAARAAMNTPSDAPVLRLAQGAGEEDRTEMLTLAAMVARQTGKAVYLSY